MILDFNNLVHDSEGSDDEEDREFLRQLNERQFESDINVLDDMIDNPESYLSTYEMINAIEAYDKSIELIGIVFEMSRIVNINHDNRMVSCLKFTIIGNFGPAVEIRIYGDDLISRYKPNLRINSIMHFEGLFAEPCADLSYVLVITHDTIVNCLKI